MTEIAEKSLLEEIDETARALLAKVRQDDKVEKTELFIEQVKGFEAVVKWASVRQIIAPPPPPEKKESKFERTKRSFNGEADSRRGNPRSPKASGNGAGGDAAAPEIPAARAAGSAANPADDVGDDEVSIEDL